jgi:NAD dependent epimerase/dehydratase family enzyme
MKKLVVLSVAPPGWRCWRPAVAPPGDPPRTCQDPPGKLGIRTVLIRSGIVLSRPDGALPINLRGASWSRPGIVLDTRHGALPLMALPFRFFVGGPINATAPEPQTNREFSKTLGKVIGRPAWLPVPGFALKLGGDYGWRSQ